MPAGPRIRSNSEFGLITDNPLTVGATTFNSARLSLMPVVSAAHAVVTLDPRAVNGEPEIVIITAHTAAATVATITRGAYGTVARAHPAGTEWIHAPLGEDMIDVLTSSTRPSNPYEGQLIFETDTNKFVGYTGTDWASRDAGGQLAYAQNTSTGFTTSAGTEIDVPLLTVSPTIPTGRRIKISGLVMLQGTVAGDQFDIRIHKDGSAVQIAIMTITGTSPNNTLTWYPKFVESPTAGVHTYKLTAIRRSGTGVASLVAAGNAPAFILVEDIGAA